MIHLIFVKEKVKNAQDLKYSPYIIILYPVPVIATSLICIMI